MWVAVAVTLALVGCGSTTDVNTEERTAKDELRVCFAENDPPRSQRGGTGFDTDVARQIAAQLDRRLVTVWIPEEEQTDIESTDADYRPLLTGQCHLQLSVPGAAAIERFRGWLVLSEPYYGAAFELIPADASFRFGEPYPETVAVRANTVAHPCPRRPRRVLVPAGGQRRHRSGRRRRQRHRRARLGSPTSRCSMSSETPTSRYPPVLRWNLHAALRRDNPLRADVDRILTSTSFKERVPELLARHGVPVRGPFAAVHTAALLQSL